MADNVMQALPMVKGQHDKAVLPGQ